MNAENQFLLLYSPIITNRLDYIFHFILEDILGLKINITDDIVFYKDSKLPKFAYSHINNINAELFLNAHQILFESDIKDIEIDLFEYKGNVAFFKNADASFLPFDLFAASFYLVSRYEEYLPFSPDKHNRFPASASLAVKGNFLEEPIIDIWANLLKIRLLESYPLLKFKPRQFKFLSTIDIDNAFAHLHKGFIRNFLSGIKLIYSNPSKIIEKIRVLARIQPDPYDNYDYLYNLHKLYGIEAIYFILFSKYGKHDKNLHPKSRAFKTLIRKINTLYSIGMHPSYASNKNFEAQLTEKKTLELVIGNTITKSRQHFLKLNLPETYENLIALEIEEDHTMGYSEKPGFRASTCSPFPFFNLKTNQSSKLKIFPFAIMDVCFKDYLGCSTSSALIKIKKIISSIQKVDGLFISLWHNESLNPSDNQFSWRYVYERMLDATKNGS